MAFDRLINKLRKLAEKWNNDHSESGPYYASRIEDIIEDFS